MEQTSTQKVSLVLLLMALAALLVFLMQQKIIVKPAVAISGCFSDCNGEFLIIDNTDTNNGFSTKGDWNASSIIPGSFKGVYLFARPGKGNIKAVWEISGITPKNYRVFASWARYSNRASNAPFTINHINGSTTVRVNQKINGEKWNYLGEFDLNNDSSIILDNNANGYVVADAIKLEN